VGTIHPLEALIGVARPTRQARSDVSEAQRAFFDDLLALKRSNKQLKPEELVTRVDWSRLERTPTAADVVGARGLSDEVANTWDALTPSEKLLCVGYPKQALAVLSAKNKAISYTRQNYGTTVDGSKANAFQHAIWNALMARDIGSSLASSFATAHEDLPEERLKKTYNGFTGYEHKAMDLHNNAKGRECVRWYDFFASDKTLIERVQQKLQNGEMKVLVK
jgi:hypothetical protein